jgi:hypothetical protein
MVFDPVTFTTGREFTVTVTVFVFTQPLRSVPVTVYVVLVAGEAVTEAPADEESPVEGLQEYEFAPLAVRVVDAPEQTDPDAGDTVITGGWVTDIWRVAVFIHPFASVPVTV